jgi:lipopolysaccharide export LptBFGC system permease protein LptF
MDIIVKHPLYCIKGGIESKNFTNKVPKRDIDKFKRDIILRKDYMFAVMISLNSGISNYPDFHIELCHETEKPLIYVGNANQHKDIYLVLENFLKFYFFKQKDNNEHDYNNLLLKEFTDNFKQYESIRKNAENILAIAQNRLKELNNNSIRIYNHNLKDTTTTRGATRGGKSTKPPLKSPPKIETAPANEIVGSPPLVDILKEIIQYEEGNKLNIEQLKIYISSHLDKRYTEYQTNRLLISEMKRYISFRKWNSKYNGKKKLFSNLKLVVPE